MITSQYFYKKELDEILESLTLLVDTKEKNNSHITKQFDKNNINYKSQGLKAGDYAAFIPASNKFNFSKNIYIPAVVERKASLDELASNFSQKNRHRLENEFMRLKFKKYRIYLFIEDLLGYEKLIKGDYRSEYDPKAFLGSLKAFEVRYDIHLKFVDPRLSAHEIYKTLYYETKEFLLS